MINTKFKIADLIFSYIKGDINGKDKNILNDWIKASPQNKEIFKRLLSKESYDTKSNIYKKFMDQDRYPAIKRSIKKSQTRGLYKYASIAAALLIPLFVVYILLNLTGNPFHSNQLSQQISPGKSTAILYTADGKIIDLEKADFIINDKNGVVIENKNNKLTYKKGSILPIKQKERLVKTVVPRGGEYYVELSDGTKVWLNSESSIEHPVVFTKEKRIVKVKGEAYFEVSPDKNRTFIVETNDTKVEVLGTKFNIRTYEEEGYTATTLVEGIVRSTAGNNSPVTLEPSQQFVYNKKLEEYKTTTVDVKLYTSWKDGLFVFEKQKLEDILNTISRWYDVDVFYDNDNSKNIIFSGRLKRYENAESLLNIFKGIENIEFEINDKIIIVK
jgi:ferric-dicitrate binding protein FerR (iron transport regulator)